MMSPLRSVFFGPDEEIHFFQNSTVSMIQRTDLVLFLLFIGLLLVPCLAGWLVVKDVGLFLTPVFGGGYVMIAAIRAVYVPA